MIQFRWQGNFKKYHWDVSFKVTKWGLVALVFVSFFLSVILI